MIYCFLLFPVFRHGHDIKTWHTRKEKEKERKSRLSAMEKESVTYFFLWISQCLKYPHMGINLGVKIVYVSF